MVELIADPVDQRCVSNHRRHHGRRSSCSSSVARSAAGEVAKGFSQYPNLPLARLVPRGEFAPVCLFQCRGLELSRLA